MDENIINGLEEMRQRFDRIECRLDRIEFLISRQTQPLQTQ